MIKTITIIILAYRTAVGPDEVINSCRMTWQMCRVWDVTDT